MDDNELEEIRQVMFVLRHKCDDINKVEEAIVRIEELTHITEERVIEIFIKYFKGV